MSEDLFQLDNVRNHIHMINEHIKKMELEGKKDPFEFEMEILQVFPEFYDGYPFLVKKICKRGDLSMLYKMMGKLEDVEQGKNSLASVELNLGNDLAEKYLYPVVGKNKEKK